jgi:hypothetical protein
MCRNAGRFLVTSQRNSGRLELDYGLTEAKMVKRLRFKGIYEGHVSEYERGMKSHRIRCCFTFSRLVGISTDVLIDDKIELPRRLADVAKEEQ